MKFIAILVPFLLLFVLLSVGCAKEDVYETDIIEMSWSHDVDEVIEISFEYLQESKYDLGALIKNRGLAEDVSFLFVEHMSIILFLKQLAEGKVAHLMIQSYIKIMCYDRNVGVELSVSGVPFSPSGIGYPDVVIMNKNSAGCHVYEIKSST